MGAFLQMGHNSRTLLAEQHLVPKYAGIVTSPVNDTPLALTKVCSGLPDGALAIFDPQLYDPRTEKGTLKEWGYFAGLSNSYTTSTFGPEQWAALGAQIARECGAVGHAAVCSPTIAPKVITDDFLRASVDAANELHKTLAGKRIEAIQTAFVTAADLAMADRPETVASILTGTECERVYVVVEWTIEPRREIRNVDELVAVMKLVALLKDAGSRVLMSFSGPEMILWKAAGADDVATGATANVQRFARARFTASEGGAGGSTAYLFVESLLAFVRQEDVVNLQRLDIPVDGTSNPYVATALDHIAQLARSAVRLVKIPGRKTKKREGPPAWQGIGQRQYLWWFADCERRLASGTATPRALLSTAAQNWAAVRRKGYVPYISNNDGRWIEPWIDALDAFEASRANGA